MPIIVFFFFQAEDGIRDSSVTGVQTCAPPICAGRRGRCAMPAPAGRKQQEVNAWPGCAASAALHWRKKASKPGRSEEHTSELQSHLNLVCRLLLEKKKKRTKEQHQVLCARRKSQQR